MQGDKRYVVDCRESPNAAGCTLTISGSEAEVLDAACAHAITVHGADDTPELRDEVRSFMHEERETVPAK